MRSGSGCIGKCKLDWMSRKVETGYHMECMTDTLWSVNSMSRDIEAVCHGQRNPDVTAAGCHAGGIY